MDGLMKDDVDVVVLDIFSGKRENVSQHFSKSKFCLVERTSGARLCYIRWL